MKESATRGQKMQSQNSQFQLPNEFMGSNTFTQIRDLDTEVCLLVRKFTSLSLWFDGLTLSRHTLQTVESDLTAALKDCSISGVSRLLIWRHEANIHLISPVVIAQLLEGCSVFLLLKQIFLGGVVSRSSPHNMCCILTSRGAPRFIQ